MNSAATFTPFRSSWIISGRGIPQGRVFASKGTLYIDLDGAPDRILYLKSTHANTNTGWRRVSSVNV